MCVNGTQSQVFEVASCQISYDLETYINDYC
jgi:hypothetical protein